MPCATCEAAHGSRRASNAWQQAIQATSHRLARECPSCGSTLGQGIACISPDGAAMIILLAGGSKDTQTADIKAALRLARGLSE